MSDPHYFDTDERIEAALAASRLVEAFQALGVDLDDADIDAPCADRHCCPRRDVFVSLGSYPPSVLTDAAAKLEAVAQRLAHNTAAK
ncbi:hypothetical protein ACFWXK_14295 [Streptomyces sp. NPDC059070]|uniref:hypothetical protein n=1 Tax=Streptomyces sp. NPDC059070 TaxID=3346713 RepID=UPI0036760189